MTAECPPFDLDAIADPQLRALVLWCLNRVEELGAANQLLQAEVRRLEAEVLRLKGEQPPRPKSPTPPQAGPSGATPSSRSHSSERARRPDRPSRRGKDKRNLRRTLTVDAEEPLHLGPSALPPDAILVGHKATLIQELVCMRRTTRYLREEWWSASTGRTYLAPLPPGCRSGYGPRLQAQALELNYGANVTVPKLLDWLTRRGFMISKGTLVKLLTQPPAGFQAEADAVLEAGLRSAPWQQLDVTATPVRGEWQACHVLGGPLYRYFRTAPGQSRLDLLVTLRGGRPVRHLLDEAALDRLKTAGVGARIRARLRRLCGRPECDTATLTAWLAQTFPRLGRGTQERIREATALSAYRADPDWPVISCLLGDDAAQFRELVAELALCWVHDGRHYHKLDPRFASFRAQLEAFLARYWAFYRRLLAYRAAPTAADATALSQAFDELFAAGQTHYAELERCITRTRENKAKLLLVLKHPELPLHNNETELEARRRVMKRRASHGPQSLAGARAWDLFHTLAATAARHGINFADYLYDRLAQRREVAWLPDLIAQRAGAENLGRSWAAG